MHSFLDFQLKKTNGRIIMMVPMSVLREKDAWKVIRQTLFRNNVIKMTCLGKVKQNNASYFKIGVYITKENVQDSYKFKNQKTYPRFVRCDENDLNTIQHLITKPCLQLKRTSSKHESLTRSAVLEILELCFNLW